MAKRKSKKPQQEESSILLESLEPRSKRKLGSSVSPALLFVIISTVGVSMLGCFCVQQQCSLDELTESFTTMQRKITNLQQVMERAKRGADAQTDAGLGVEERIFALEEAQKKAQEKAEVALATSEELKNSDLNSQLWVLRDEMDTRLAEINHVSLSVTSFQAMFKNHSEEFEAVKESMVAGLSSASALAENVAGLTSAVARACSRADGQIASMEVLNAQLEGQVSELNELKESVHLQNAALYSNSQEMAAIKELIKAQQAMRAQALEEMLSSVQMTLDEQFSTSQTLHSNVMAQLQTVHTQLANAPSLSMQIKSDEEASTKEESISSTAQSETEEQEKSEDVVDVELKAELQNAEDEAEDVTKEEEKKAIQEEQLQEQMMIDDVTEQHKKEEEDVTIEEEEDEDITGQSEELEVGEETAMETVDGHILDKSLKGEESEGYLESLMTAKEEGLMDETEE